MTLFPQLPEKNSDKKLFDKTMYIIVDSIIIELNSHTKMRLFLISYNHYTNNPN